MFNTVCARSDPSLCPRLLFRVVSFALTYLHFMTMFDELFYMFTQIKLAENKNPYIDLFYWRNIFPTNKINGTQSITQKPFYVISCWSIDFRWLLKASFARFVDFKIRTLKELRKEIQIWVYHSPKQCSEKWTAREIIGHLHFGQLFWFSASDLLPEVTWLQFHLH